MNFHPEMIIESFDGNLVLILIDLNILGKHRMSTTTIITRADRIDLSRKTTRSLVVLGFLVRLVGL